MHRDMHRDICQLCQDVELKRNSQVFGCSLSYDLSNLTSLGLPLSKGGLGTDEESEGSLKVLGCCSVG